MIKRTIVIDSDKFSDLEEFYSEIDNLITRNLDWKTGRNLDAFNDLLRGGFGIFEYEEPINLFWKNPNKSKTDLGEELYNKLVTIIRRHEHIEFKEI